MTMFYVYKTEQDAARRMCALNDVIWTLALEADIARARLPLVNALLRNDIEFACMQVFISIREEMSQ